MKRSLVSAILVAATLLPTVARAKALKIGVVNMRRAISETDEGKAAEKKLRRLKKRLESTLNRKLKEFYAEEQKLRKAWSILKDGEKRKRARASQAKFQGLQKEYMQAERQLMRRKTRVMMAITKKLTKVIQRIAKASDYDYIFTNAAVLWAPRHVDITNEVIRRYNKSK